MKKARESKTLYDFAGGERGRYARRFAEGTNLVLLEKDVAKAFPDAKAVNTALRALIGSSSAVRAGSKKKAAGSRVTKTLEDSPEHVLDAESLIGEALLRPQKKARKKSA